METIHTKRLTLRPWTLDDIDFVYDMYSRWDVQRFIGIKPRVMESREEAVERIERWQNFDTWQRPDDAVQGMWAVTESASGELLGALLLKPIPASGPNTPLEPSDDTEIGWHFHPDAWAKGYATEAASAVLRHAFDRGLEKVVAVTSPKNFASQRVCERIGMIRRGLTDMYYNTSCELFVATNPTTR